MSEWIGRKIEEIRRKPEHIRVFYVWVGVLVAMFFVVLIWVFTLRENLSRSSPAEDVKQIQERIPAAAPSQEMKSLDEVFGTQKAPAR